MMIRLLPLAALAALLCFVGGPSRADDPADLVWDLSGPEDPSAGGLGGNRLFNGVHGRGRVVQFTAVAMCVALFILIKKFAEPGGPPQGPDGDNGERPA